MKAESAGVGRAFREIFAGIGSMPRAMRQLAVVQFFTWFALFCMWLYFVPAVATGVFHGRPLSLLDPASKRLIEGEGGPRYIAEAAGTGARLRGAQEGAGGGSVAKRGTAAVVWCDPPNARVEACGA